MRVHVLDSCRFCSDTATISTGPSCSNLHSNSATSIAAFFAFAAALLKFDTLAPAGSTIAPRRSNSATALRALISRNLPNGSRQSSHSHTCLDSARRDIVGSALAAPLMRSITSAPNHWPHTHTAYSYLSRFPVSSVSERQVIDRAYSSATWTVTEQYW